MGDKLMCTVYSMFIQNYLFGILQLADETQLNEPSNQISMKVPLDFKPKNKKTLL